MRDHSILTLQQAAQQLGISANAVRHMLEDGTLLGTQVVPCSPWLISATALGDERVVRAVQAIRSGKRRPQPEGIFQETLAFTDL